MAKGPLLLISITKYKQKQTYEISIPTENIPQISTVVDKHCRCFRLKYQNSILTSSSLRTTVNWRTNKLNLLFLFFVHDLLLFFHGSSDLLGAGLSSLLQGRIVTAIRTQSYNPFSLSLWRRVSRCSCSSCGVCHVMLHSRHRMGSLLVELQNSYHQYIKTESLNMPT